MFRPRSLVVAVIVGGLSVMPLHAGDLRLPLPKKSKYTPVQKLNREGVSAVEKHDYKKAKKLFYEAYLIDPNDPFTLNNLGYLAELEGETDRAQRFYELASEQNSDAVIDKASNDSVEGKPVSAVAGNAQEKGIRINRLNNQAIALLEKDRAPEADLVLQKALTLDSRNPFTLNNLGYAKEKEGELDAAYQFYSAAASLSSREQVQVALDPKWRGQEISAVARDNARKLNRRMHDVNNTESRVAILNLRAVSAINRNDRRTAKDFIQQAFKLDPTDAFTLNNMGYLAELDGDRETADYYYGRARDANRNNARITLATRKDVQGKKIGEVASNTDTLVLTKMEQDQVARQQQGGPVMLRRRDSSAVVEPLQPVAPATRYRVSDANGNLILPPLQHVDSSQPIQQGGGLAMPLPDKQQPTTVHQGESDGGLMMPLPEDQQPGSQAQPSNVQAPQQKQGPNNNGLTMPLPDNQQPGAQPQPQGSQTQPQQGQIDHGLMMPLPDDQQPGTQPKTPQQAQQPQSSQPGPGQVDQDLVRPFSYDQQQGKPATPQQQNQQAPAVGAPVTNQPTTAPVPIQPVPSAAPATSQPATNQPAVTVPANTPPTSAPAVTQPSAPATTNQPAQPAPKQQQPPLLLPPPDNQQPKAQTTPQNNQGAIATKPPKKISDTDPPKPKQPTNNPNSGVTKISDQ